MDDDREWETFLEENRVKMTKRINPSRLYDWLRTRGVLTEEDQQEVETGAKTTFSRCGLLIDIVKRKGRPGFDALMEIIQYEYPHLYKHLTDKEPQKPPKWFRESFKKRSHLFELMPQLVNMLDVISNEMVQKKDDLKRLINDLKDENENLRRRLDSIDSMEKEYNALQKQLLKNQAYCIELTREKEALHEHCSELVQSRDEALEQVNDLEEKVHGLELELDNSKGECKIERSKSRKLRNEMESVPSSDDMARMSIENATLKVQLNKLKQQMTDVDDSEPLESRLIKAQQDKKKAEDEKDELQSTNEELQQQRENLKMQVGQLQERIEKQGERLQIIKDERDKYLKNSENLNREVTELTTSRDKLESERDELWRLQDDLQLEVQHLKNTVDKMRGHARSAPNTPSSSLEEDYPIEPARPRAVPVERRPERRDGTLIDGHWPHWSYVAPDD